MGCSPSMIVPYPNKGQLIGTAIFSAHLRRVSKDFSSDENQNTVKDDEPTHPKDSIAIGVSLQNTDESVPNRITTQNRPSETSLRNGIMTNDINLSLNQSTNIILADTKSEPKVVPDCEQNTELNITESDSSSRNSSGRMRWRRQSYPAEMKTGIKSVLKQGNPADHMLANRPIKTVTFVESVTVVRVM